MNKVKTTAIAAFANSLTPGDSVKIKKGDTEEIKNSLTCSSTKVQMRQAMTKQYSLLALSWVLTLAAPACVYLKQEPSTVQVSALFTIAGILLHWLVYHNKLPFLKNHTTAS